jgi:hypothetical protein
VLIDVGSVVVVGERQTECLIATQKICIELALLEERVNSTDAAFILLMGDAYKSLSRMLYRL